MHRRSHFNKRRKCPRKGTEFQHSSFIGSGVAKGGPWGPRTPPPPHGLTFCTRKNEDLSHSQGVPGLDSASGGPGLVSRTQGLVSGAPGLVSRRRWGLVSAPSSQTWYHGACEHGVRGPSVLGLRGPPKLGFRGHLALGIRRPPSFVSGLSEIGLGARIWSRGPGHGLGGPGLVSGPRDWFRVATCLVSGAPGAWSQPPPDHGLRGPRA